MRETGREEEEKAVDVSEKGAVKGCEKGSGVGTMRAKTEPAEKWQKR